VNVNEGKLLNVNVVPLTVAGPAAGVCQLLPLLIPMKYDTPAVTCASVNARLEPAAIVIVTGTINETYAIGVSGLVSAVPRDPSARVRLKAGMPDGAPAEIASEPSVTALATPNDPVNEVPLDAISGSAMVELVDVVKLALDGTACCSGVLLMVPEQAATMAAATVTAAMRRSGGMPR
jgi:hypothetical protein